MSKTTNKIKKNGIQRDKQNMIESAKRLPERKDVEGPLKPLASCRDPRSKVTGINRKQENSKMSYT
jgi:hypothetical protein